MISNHILYAGSNTSFALKNKNKNKTKTRFGHILWHNKNVQPRDYDVNIDKSTKIYFYSSLKTLD